MRTRRHRQVKLDSESKNTHCQYQSTQDRSARLGSVSTVTFARLHPGTSLPSALLPSITRSHRAKLHVAFSSGVMAVTAGAVAGQVAVSERTQVAAHGGGGGEGGGGGGGALRRGKNENLHLKKNKNKSCICSGEALVWGGAQSGLDKLPVSFVLSRTNGQFEPRC